MRYGENIFLRMTANFNKLTKYGFIKKGVKYIYSKNFMQNEFRAEIQVDSNGKLSGKVIELDTGEEYLPIHVEAYIGTYVGTIRETYLSILEDISKNCFRERMFISAQANRISEKILEVYGESSDNPFSKLNNIAVYRYPKNQKWYALVMNIKESLLITGKKENGSPDIEIMNLKIDTSKFDEIHKLPGVYPAYHMNHSQWISITLNESLKDEKIMDLINTSRDYAINGRKANSKTSNR